MLPIMTKAMINMELVRRRTWIFFDIRTDLYIPYRDEKTPAREATSIIATFFGCSSAFPRSGKILSHCPKMRFIPRLERAICNFLRLMAGTEDAQDLSEPLPYLL